MSLEAFGQLSASKSLRSVSLRGVKASPEELAEMRKNLPNVSLVVDNGRPWIIHPGRIAADAVVFQEATAVAPSENQQKPPQHTPPKPDRGAETNDKLKAEGAGVTGESADPAHDPSDSRTVQYTETRTNRLPDGRKIQGLIRRVKVLGRYRQREEMQHTPGDQPESGDSSTYVQIIDAKKGIHLTLWPDDKNYEYVKQILGISDKGEIVESKPEPQPQIDYYGRMRDVPVETATKLPDRYIDGKLAHGFELVKKVEQSEGTDTWTRKYYLDPQTKLPVRIEISLRTNSPHRAESDWVKSDIVFDRPLDAKLFSTEPPDGYQERPER